MARTRVSSGQIVGNLVFDGNTGITVPRGNTANRNPSPNQGEIRYNTDLNVMEIYNGTAWGSMGPFPFAFTEYFIGDGTTYEFLLSNSVANANDIIVTNNGVQMRANKDFRIFDGNVLSFTEEDSTQHPPIDRAEINVRGFSPITSASVPAGSITLNELNFSDGSAGQFLTTDGNGVLSFGNVTFPSNYNVGGDVTGTTDNIQIKANTIGVNELQVSDGQMGQVLATDGSGNLSFITVSGGSGGGGTVANFFDLSGQIAYSQIPNSLITIEKVDVVDGSAGDLLSTDGAGNFAFVSPNNIADTDGLSEGANNLYFTNTRADARADLRIAAAELSDLNNVDTTAPSTDQALIWDGSAGKWKPGTVASSQNVFATFTGDTGTTTANTTTDTLTISGGTGISTSIVGDVLTITNTGGAGGSQNLFETIAVAGQNSVVADVVNDTLTFAGGSGLTITTNNLTDTITFAVDNANKFTSVVSDNGTVTPSTSDDAVTIAGGTGIGTIVAGSTLTINNDAPNWLNIASDSGTATANTVGDTLTITGGTGITTAVVGDTLTINSSTSANTFNTISVNGQGDVVADSTTDTLTLVAGSNITLTTDPTTDEITINASAGSGGSGTVTSGLAGRLAYYSATGTTIVNTSSGLSWNNGTNTLSVQNINITGTAGSITSTGTITAAVIDAPSIQSSGAGTPTLQSGNDLLFDVVGEINLQDTKITRLTDPTNAQDAATKKYVDENTLTSFGIGADDSTIRNVSAGESIKIIGGTNVTTASDAEGNITINASGNNLFSTIAVSGQNNIVADSTSDTLTLVAGTNISITTDSGTDSVTINSSGASQLNDLSDIDTSGLASGDMLYYDGTDFVPTSGPVLEWSIGANGASDYTFQGPGITGTQNDPTLYLYKGFTYIFNNTTGNSHPFYIKTTPGTGTGNLYSTGVTNNGSISGNKTIFTVPMNAPATLYYQCSLHASMVGTINIT